ncbi:hypothetical protein AU693_001833 [Salmonella enterica subsp. diarizonae]|nr:hypothetical protein [Salmonella enterica subsp. diarizonae]
MSAKLITKSKQYFPDGSFMEIVIWLVNPPVRASQHEYKYRLAYVENNVCVVRYDNEAGKGDHKHIGSDEIATTFTSISQLCKDFETDVLNHRRR